MDERLRIVDRLSDAGAIAQAAGRRMIGDSRPTTPYSADSAAGNVQLPFRISGPGLYILTTEPPSPTEPSPSLANRTWHRTGAEGHARQRVHSDLPLRLGRVRRRR
jgi:hypothetical protein